MTTEADPIDVALDELAQLIAHPSPAARVTVRVLHLWREVFERALARGDSQLAAVAATEWRTHRRAGLAVLRLPD